MVQTSWLPRPLFRRHCYFQTSYKNPDKNQNFSKILFASFHMMQEASERWNKHFSIWNIKGAENISWSFPVHLFSDVPGWGLNNISFLFFVLLLFVWVSRAQDGNNMNCSKKPKDCRILPHRWFLKILAKTWI